MAPFWRYIFYWDLNQHGEVFTEAGMSQRRKTDRDSYDQITTELTPQQAKRLVDESKSIHEKETVPEIPVHKLLTQYQREQIETEKAQKKSTRRGSSHVPTPADREKTKPGVPIRVGKNQVLWVEEDILANRDESDDTGEIIG